MYDIYMYLAKTPEGSKTVITDIGGLEWDHVFIVVKRINMNSE